MPATTVPAFVRKWTASMRTEKAASQEHFINLCQLLGHETPNDDPTGDRFAFEKREAWLNSPTPGKRTCRSAH